MSSTPGPSSWPSRSSIGMRGDLADRPHRVEVPDQQNAQRRAPGHSREDVIRRRCAGQPADHRARRPRSCRTSQRPQASSAARSVLGDSARPARAMNASRRSASRSQADKNVHAVL